MVRPADHQIVQLLDRYSLATTTVRQRVVEHTSSLWTGMGSWRDADVARFTAQAVPVVRAGKRQMASLTDGYLATMARVVLGSGRPVGISNAVLDATRGGVPLDEVYRRPGVTVWTAVANGQTWEAAAARGLARLVSMVATDMQLARTHAAREVFSNDDRVTGFMRVTSGLCCELCDLASDQRYSTDDLMPIHNNCSCDVEPIYASEDPGNLSTGEPTEDQGDTPEVRQHGELGPVLTVAGQHFTGADDLAA